MTTRLFLNVSFDWIKNTLDSKRRRYSFPLNISCSVICCALASLIPLVTRSFHADRVVAISLIICYIVALILSLLTGLEILWPPVRDESSWIINMNNKIKISLYPVQPMKKREFELGWHQNLVLEKSVNRTNRTWPDLAKTWRETFWLNFKV